MKVVKKYLLMVVAVLVAFSYIATEPIEVYAAGKKPSKVTINSVKSVDYNAVKITWKKASNAKKYEVYRSNSKNGTFKKVKTTESKSFKNTGLTTGKTYYYKVRGINGNKKGAFSVVKSATPKLKKVTSLIVTRKSKTSIKLSWKKVNGAKGYQVYRSATKSGTYKKIKTTTSTSFINKNLKSGKKYYYKVRAYRVVNGKNKYSNFSDRKTVGSSSGKKTCVTCNGSGKCTICKGNGKCPYCEGKGTHTCTSCWGTDMRIKSHSSRGDRSEKCTLSSCNKGKIECWSCNGDKKCFSCDGDKKCITCAGKGSYSTTGTKRTLYSYKKEECEHCDGVGKDICNMSWCNKGECKECNGTGERKNSNGQYEECKWCRGYGICNMCYGKYKMDCKWCITGKQFVAYSFTVGSNSSGDSSSGSDYEGDYYPNGSLSCDECGGTGRTHCWDCIGGQCPNCAGDGYYYVYSAGKTKKVDCSQCTGGKCRKCGGRNEVPCPKC